MSMFEPREDIFQNRDTLREGYIPDEIVGRDAELKQYQAALQPVINGEQPNNIFVYGKPGVGKTAATKYLLGELRHSANEHDVPVSIIYNTCKGQNTSYQAAISIINQIRDEEPLSETGHPEAKVYRILGEELSTLTGAILIVLDEVDYITDDILLYQLTRGAGSGDSNVNQIVRDFDEGGTDVVEAISGSMDDSLSLGVIGISNDTTFRDRLGGQVKSSLSEKSISFPSYDANGLKQVLSHRVNLAFHDGALEDGVIELCAAYGAQDGGDARHAIELLLEAGDLARNDKSDTVTREHVEAAKDIKEEEEIVSVMETLSDHEKLTLYALTVLHEQEKTPVRSREVYDVYVEFVDRYQSEPRTLRRVRDYLSDFDLVEITNSTRVERGGDDGVFNEHELRRDAATVVGAISDIVELVGVHEAITSYISPED